jgi:hypothetical protein
MFIPVRFPFWPDLLHEITLISLIHTHKQGTALSELIVVGIVIVSSSPKKARPGNV